MTWKRYWRRKQLDDDFEEEIKAHIAHEIDRNISAGMDCEQARAGAVRKFGNVTASQEVFHDMNSIGIIETVWKDLRHGIRLLRLNKTFTVVAVLSLALGMGANIAIFQLLDAVRLRSLPVNHPEQLAEIQIVAPNGRAGDFESHRPMMTYPLWEQIRSRQRSFSDLIAWGTSSFNLSPAGEVRKAQGIWVSGGFFQALGINAIQGRTLTEEDDVRGCANPGAVISYGFWQSEFGGSPSVIGRTLSLEGRPFEVTGITPASFFGPEVGRTFDVALPLCARALIGDGSHDKDFLDARNVWWLALIGRLKLGWTIENATSDLRSIAPSVFEDTLPTNYPPDVAKDYLKFQMRAVPAASGVSALRRDYETPLWILMAATGFVLLIACANIANLTLARASARQREISIRLAIGASRRRVIRQLFAESFLLAAIGGVLAVGMARACSQLLVSFLSTEQNHLFLVLNADSHLSIFIAALVVFTCLLFGLLPAFRATHVAPGSAMKAAGRGLTASRERLGFRRLLVVSQVALSLVLLFGALLFARSLRNLLVLDSGFRQDGVLVVDTDLGRLQYPEAQRTAVYDQLTERLTTAAQVQSIAQVTIVPISGNGWNDNVLLDQTQQKGMSNFNQVSPGYFKTMGIAFKAGRNFDSRDTPSSPKVVIVDETFAQRFFKNEDPIGQHFHLEVGAGKTPSSFEIIGVVGRSKYGSLRDDFAPTVYKAASQDEHPQTSTSYVLRSSAPLGVLTASVKRTIAGLNPDIAIEFEVLSTNVRNSLLQERLMATLTGFFGLIAAALSTIGLYGMLSYAVTQRRNEIGIRMALGANRRDVVAMVLREAGILVVVGLAVGTVATLLVTRAAATLLFGLTPHDPLTLAIAIGALAAVALLAGYLPARRAANVEPTTVLREE